MEAPALKAEKCILGQHQDHEKRNGQAIYIVVTHTTGPHWEWVERSHFWLFADIYQ